MTPNDIARLRLHNQHIAHSKFPDGPSGRTPGEVVAWMGAVQAQFFQGRIPGSGWAVGLRLPHTGRLAGATEAAIERVSPRVWTD